MTSLFPNWLQEKSIREHCELFWLPLELLSRFGWPLSPRRKLLWIGLHQGLLLVHQVPPQHLHAIRNHILHRPKSNQCCPHSSMLHWAHLTRTHFHRPSLHHSMHHHIPSISFIPESTLGKPSAMSCWTTQSFVLSKQCPQSTSHQIEVCRIVRLGQDILLLLTGQMCRLQKTVATQFVGPKVWGVQRSRKNLPLQGEQLVVLKLLATPVRCHLYASYVLYLSLL